MIKKTKVQDYIIITDDLVLNENAVRVTSPKEEAIGFVFYASGKVTVDITQGKTKKQFEKQTGMASSFYVHPDDTSIIHQISKKTPLKRVTFFLSPQKLESLIENDPNSSMKHFKKLINPSENFVDGTNLKLVPEMQNAVHKIINCQYTGAARELLLESQVIELFSHYLNQLSNKSQQSNTLKISEIDKLHHAKDILLKQIDSPPSLNELSRLAGINTYKLKTGFKEIFGEPVYKYLQSERMKKAYELLEDKNVSIQEAAWFVGYESLSSFSNAFLKKFGFRPSKTKR